VRHDRREPLSPNRPIKDIFSGQIHEFLQALFREGYTAQDAQDFTEHGGILIPTCKSDDPAEQAVWK